MEGIKKTELEIKGRIYQSPIETLKAIITENNLATGVDKLDWTACVLVITKWLDVPSLVREMEPLNF